MAKRKNNSFKGVLGVIIAICIIIVFAAIIYVYLISPLLNNPDNDSPTAEPEKFTLSVNDKIYSENSTIELYSNYTVFDVYCDKEFTVEILPLDGINFDYFVAGKSCRYSEVDNLFDVFGVVYTDTGFSINPPQGDIVDILAKYHGVDRESILIDGDISKIKAFFSINISTSDSTLSLTCIYGSRVSDIELSEDEIVF